MATFNWSSINKKIKAATESQSFKNRAYANASAEVSALAIDAAENFISTIQDEIGSAGFSAGQAGVISTWSHGSPFNVANGSATITVSSASSEGIALYSRESVNLVDVFSRGHTPSKYVYGDWHGAYIRSSRSLTYNDFIGSAIEKFTGYTGNGYEVTNVSRRD